MNGSLPVWGQNQGACHFIKMIHRLNKEPLENRGRIRRCNRGLCLHHVTA